MKVYIYIFSALLIIVGLIMMYVGYNMAQGQFGGVAYYPGDYTTFIIGCVCSILGFIISVFNFSYYKRKANSISGVIESKHKKTKILPTIIRIIAILVGLYGLIMILLGIADNALYTFKGIGVLVFAILLYGLSYIIHAAILYTNKQIDK